MSKGKELSIKYKTLLGNSKINTPLRLAYFFGELEAESNLVPKRESLYYTTIKGLRNTFYSPFKGKSDAFVKQYLRNSVKCANYVYANRGGNGNEASGDGYKYRGGGFIQNTFKDGYEQLAKDTGIPFDKNPDLITEEANAMIAAINYWVKNDLNKYADKDDIDAVSDIINKGRKTSAYGDANGFKERKEAVEKYKKEFT